MERKRLFTAYGVVTILVVAFILVLALALGKRSPQPPVETVEISVSGTLGCMPHKNSSPDQAQTMECAIGLRTDDGRFYSVGGLTSEQIITDGNTRVYITGRSSPPSANTIYDIVGEITVTRFSSSSK